MDLFNKIIQSSTKPKLMAVTCVATLVAPYAFSALKDVVINAFDK